MIWNMRRRKKKGYTYRFRNLTYASAQSASYEVKFRSGENKTNFFGLVVYTSKRRILSISYKNENGALFDAYMRNSGGWVNEAYETITFEKPPTGELLAFLQENAEPL